LSKVCWYHSSEDVLFSCRKKGKGAKAGKKSESIVKTAAANSKVWEARLDIAEKTKQEYRY